MNAELEPSSSARLVELELDYVFQQALRYDWVGLGWLLGGVKWINGALHNRCQTRKTSSKVGAAADGRMLFDLKDEEEKRTMICDDRLVEWGVEFLPSPTQW